MRRVVVTGGRSPLGRCVVRALRAQSEFESVRGLESRPLPEERNERDLVFIPFVPDHRQLAEYLEKEGIDTVIQCGLVPDRSGVGTATREAGVISTMCLGAAVAQSGSPIRNWILASSSAIYPIGSQAALLQREGRVTPREDDVIPASIAEAEEYARDVAQRLPHVNVSILRLQQIVGEAAFGPLASLLARDPLPTPIGFDPAIQLLHLDDAASALAFAARNELAGVYNVASKGIVRWHAAARALGRTGLPVLPMSVALLEPLLERLHLPYIPGELLDLLRFGHAIDTEKIERAGWRPAYDQLGCLRRIDSG